MEGADSQNRYESLPIVGARRCTAAFMTLTNHYHARERVDRQSAQPTIISIAHSASCGLGADQKPKPA